MLNAEQQPKFQAMREQARRRVIGDTPSGMVHKLEDELVRKTWFTVSSK
jgi:hypothetical protein